MSPLARFTALVVVALLHVVAASNAATAATKHALVVGIDRYDNLAADRQTSAARSRIG